LSRILVVDDHPAIAQACGYVFESIGINDTFSAHDVESGFRAFVDHRPDTSVIDLSLEGNELAGIDLIRRIHAYDRSARILVFSMRSDRKSFFSAVDAGAMSYVLKDSSVEEFASAVERTRSGRRYIDRRFALNLAFPKNAALSSREQRIVEMLRDEPAPSAPQHGYEAVP
jgi:two-component system, NarL family, invasion response regulator UvrY